MPCEHHEKFQYVIVLTATEQIRWCRQCGALKGWKPLDQVDSREAWQLADGKEMPPEVFTRGKA